MMVRLILADDHRMMREGLKSLLAEDGKRWSVIGEAENGRSAVEMTKKLNPHVVVMDVAMPDLNGIEATRQMVRENPNVKIVGLSGHPDQHFVREMLIAGASAYILKSRAYEELTTAIDEVMKGKTYLSPEVTRGVVDTYVRARPKPGENPAFAMLTEREREVLQRIAEGQATKEIAEHLDVSLKTVETHRRNIMEKINLHSVAELTKYAIREGITSIEN